MSPEERASLLAHTSEMLVKTTRPRPEVARREQELLAFAQEVHSDPVPSELVRAIAVAVDNDQAAWALERQLWVLRVAKAERRIRELAARVEELEAEAEHRETLEAIARIDQKAEAAGLGPGFMDEMFRQLLEEDDDPEPLGPYGDMGQAGSSFGADP